MYRLRAGVSGNGGAALHNPAFSALINAAGGLDQVGDFCVTLLDQSSGQPSGQPSAPSPSAPGQGDQNGQGNQNGHHHGAQAGVHGHGSLSSSGGNADVSGGLDISLQP